MRLAAPIDYTDSSTLRVGLGQTPIVVSFSGGKDCVAAWQALRESGANVVAAVYLYLVPGLSFVESHLDRCERQFSMAIERWPHPSLNRMLRNGVFQPPTHRRASDALPPWTMPRMDKWVQRRWPGSLLALGARVTDNLTRRVASKHHHAEYNRKRRTLWPIPPFFVHAVTQVGNLPSTSRCTTSTSTMTPPICVLNGRICVMQ